MAHERCAHKIVAMSIRYVHAEDDPVRKMTELMVGQRKAIIGARLVAEATA